MLSTTSLHELVCKRLSRGLDTILEEFSEHSLRKVLSGIVLEAAECVNICTVMYYSKFLGKVILMTYLRLLVPCSLCRKQSNVVQRTSTEETYVSFNCSQHTYQQTYVESLCLIISFAQVV